jgi:hypothetical protein
MYDEQSPFVKFILAEHRTPGDLISLELALQESLWRFSVALPLGA